MKTKIIIWAFAFVLLLSIVNATELRVNSTTADGWVQEDHPFWNDAHGNTDGDTLDSTETENSQAISVFDDRRVNYIFRSFFYFDTSAIPDTDTIDAASMNLFGVTNYESNVSVQNGTQADTLTTADYDSCQPLPSAGGGEFGHTEWSAGWNVIGFNSLGKSNINKVGTTKICAREYYYDYLDVDVDGGSAKNGVTFAENITYVPYLNITHSEAEPEDTCSPDSPLTANHLFDCSDNCTLSSNLNAGGYNITITDDAGTFDLASTANITNYNKIFIVKPSSCKITIYGKIIK